MLRMVPLPRFTGEDNHCSVTHSPKGEEQRPFAFFVIAGRLFVIAGLDPAIH